MTMLGSDNEDTRRKPRAQRRVTLEFAPSFYDDIEAAGLEQDLGFRDACYQALRDYTNRSSELDA